MKQTSFTQSDVYSPKENVQVVERIVEVRQPVTIELTSKTYKIWMLGGWLLLIVGGVLAVLSITYGLWSSLWIALAGMVLGIVVNTAAHLLAWWNNG